MSRAMRATSAAARGLRVEVGDNERDTVAREVPQARATSRRVGGYQGRLYMVPVLQVGLFIRRTKPTFKCFSPEFWEMETPVSKGLEAAPWRP